MTGEEIYSRLREIFVDVLDDENITLKPETTAADIKDWDSANHINLIVAIEMRFGIKFKNAEVEQLDNVGDFVALIEKKLAKKK